MKREEKKYKKERKESSEKERNYAIEKLKKITILQNSNEQNKDFWLHGFPFFCLVRCFVISFFFHSFFQTSSCDWFIYKIRMLFVCVCTFLVIYLKHLNEYIYWKYTFSLVLHIKAIYCISIQIFIGFFVVFVVVVVCHFWFEAKLIFQHLFHFMRWVVLNKLVLIWEFSYRSERSGQKTSIEKKLFV